MTENERLKKALKEIEHEIQWYFVTCGAVSHDDVRNMFFGVQKSVKAVSDILHPDTGEDEETPPRLDDDF